MANVVPFDPYRSRPALPGSGNLLQASPALPAPQTPQAGLAGAPPLSPPVRPVPLETRKQWFQDSQDLTFRARKACEQDRDYRDHKQWTAYELDRLRRRNQPPIVVNHIARKVDSIIGIAERSASDPKGYPRTPKDEEAAQVCTDTLRFICDVNRYPRIKSAMLENIVVEGTAGAEVIVEEKGGQYEVVVNRLRWEEIFADPYSREPDFSDARYKGLAKWMHVEDVGAIWGEEAQEMAEKALGSNTLTSGSFDDRPRSMSAMTDLRGKRVVVVDMYCRHGEAWHHYVFCAAGDLIPGGASPYLDEEGEPACPIELQSLYVNRENERYGFVRGMLGPQDESNYRRSKILHRSSVRQSYSTAQAGINVDKAKRELARPDGHVEMQAGEWNKDFGIIPQTDLMEGEVLLLQDAKQEIAMFGPNNALQGRGSDTQSGKAWQAQQQAGLAEIAVLYAAAADLDLRLYRQMWMRARQYYTEQRYIRITDNDQSFKFLTINEPVFVQDEQGNPVMDPMTGQPVPEIDPNTGQQAVRNRPAEMDVDIIVDASPDYINSQQEEAEMLMRLVEQGIPIPPELIIIASNTRNKRELLEALKAKQEQPPPPDPKTVSEIGKNEADTHLKHAQAMKIESEIGMMPPEEGPEAPDPLEIVKIGQAERKLDQGDRKLDQDAVKLMQAGSQMREKMRADSEKVAQGAQITGAQTAKLAADERKSHAQAEGQEIENLVTARYPKEMLLPPPPAPRTPPGSKKKPAGKTNG